MKRLLTSLVLLVAAPSLWAAVPVSLPIRLDAADLVPGARYTYEVRAYFGFVDLKQTRIDDTMLEKDFAPAPEVFSGTFTGSLTPKATPVTFHFPLPPSAPDGLTGAYVFRASLKIEPPPKSDMKPYSKTMILAGPLVGEAMAQHCLRIRGPVNGRFIHLGVADCTQEMPKMPSVPKK
jgi:hypothetical protein